MKSPFPYGNRRITVKPSNIGNDTRFLPRLSQIALKGEKRERAKTIQPNLDNIDSNLEKCGAVCLYIFIVLSFLIGGGGIGVCTYYYINSVDESTKNWKIGGIVLGGVTCIVSIILIILTRWKQANDRPWRYKSEELIVTSESYTRRIDPSKLEKFDDDELHEYLDKLKDEKDEEFTRETASSPIPNSDFAPLKTFHDDLIFCPGCNRLHLPEHQCMYSTRLPNSLTIANQTKDSQEPTPKIIIKPNTNIDRTLKLATTNETQTVVPKSPEPKIKDTVILRRVPIPTTKVVLKQPTTKVMIIRVPNVAGQLVIQPKSTFNDVV